MLAVIKITEQTTTKAKQNKGLQAAPGVLRVSVIRCKVAGTSIWTSEILKDPIRDIGHELVLASSENKLT